MSNYCKFIGSIEIDPFYVEKLKQNMAELDSKNDPSLYRLLAEKSDWKLRIYGSFKNDMTMTKYFMSLFPEGMGNIDNITFIRYTGSFFINPHIDENRDFALNIGLSGENCRTIFYEKSNEEESDYFCLKSNIYGGHRGYYKSIEEYIHRPGETYLLNTRKFHGIEKFNINEDRIIMSFWSTVDQLMDFDNISEYFG